MKKNTSIYTASLRLSRFRILCLKSTSFLITLIFTVVPMKSFAEWKKPTPEEIKKKLTPLQYKVTQQDGTEKPFDNEYWDNHKAGLYVDIVSGEPLFLSSDKFDSGTGWPSFTKPITKDAIIEKIDRGFFMTRTEIRSKIADSHLGHVFPDGPKPTGLRYCMNSASMRFIPIENLDSEGYGNFLSYFGATPSVKTRENSVGKSQDAAKSLGNEDDPKREGNENTDLKKK